MVFGKKKKKYAGFNPKDTLGVFRIIDQRSIHYPLLSKYCQYCRTEGIIYFILSAVRH